MVVALHHWRMIDSTTKRYPTSRRWHRHIFCIWRMWSTVKVMSPSTWFFRSLVRSLPKSKYTIQYH